MPVGKCGGRQSISVCWGALSFCLVCWEKKVFVLVLSGEGDAGCRDGAERAGGAGVVPEPES